MPDRLSIGERGQTELRFIIGGLFILLMGGPLIKFGVELQEGFAQMPGFSPLAAGFIAALFVASIVAAAFEGGSR